MAEDLIDDAGAPPADDATPPAEASPDAGTEPKQGDTLDKAPDGEAKEEPAGDLLSDDGDTQREGVPDQYTFEAPEGLDPNILPEERLGEFMEQAKKHGLSQDQFQGIMSYYAEQTQASVEEAVNAWNDRVDAWKQSARTDKEIGGEQFDANIKTALRAVEQFGDAEFKALLKSPSEQNPDGLAIGNNPAFLRFLNRIGKQLGDPKLVQGDTQQKGATDADRLKRMYPSMFKDSA